MQVFTPTTLVPPVTLIDKTINLAIKLLTPPPPPLGQHRPIITHKAALRPVDTCLILIATLLILHIYIAWVQVSTQEVNWPWGNINSWGQAWFMTNHAEKQHSEPHVEWHVYIGKQDMCLGVLVLWQFVSIFLPMNREQNKSIQGV